MNDEQTNPKPRQSATLVLVFLAAWFCLGLVTLGERLVIANNRGNLFGWPTIPQADFIPFRMGFVMAFLSGVAYGLRWLRAGRFDLHPDAIWGIGVLYFSTGVFCILGSWSRPEWGALEVGTTVGWLIVTGVGLVLALKPCLKRRRPEVD